MPLVEMTWTQAYLSSGKLSLGGTSLLAIFLLLPILAGHRIQTVSAIHRGHFHCRSNFSFSIAQRIHRRIVNEFPNGS